MAKVEEFEKFEQNYKCFSGFISDKPSINYSESGKIKTKFSIPLKKNKDDEPVWLNCEVWGKLAEKVADGFDKGDEIVVYGYFKETEYNGKTYLNFVVKVAC